MKNLSLFLVMLIGLNANSQIANNKNVIKSEMIYFEIDKYDLTDNAKIILNTLCRNINKEFLVQITLTGHADSTGNEVSNVTLSKNRTRAVFNYFLSKGISKDKIKIEFYGDHKPIALNDNENGKQQNRRVEICVEKKEMKKTNIFVELKKESQCFKVKANEEITICGKEGTKIVIPKNALVKAHNKNVTGEVIIELKEFYSKADIVTSNLHSVSNGQLLETGGMIYVSAICSGEKLNLRTGDSMKIEFASEGRTKGMQTFIGKGLNGQVNWVPQSQTQLSGDRKKSTNPQIKWVQKYRNSDGYCIFYYNGIYTDYIGGGDIDTAKINETNKVDKMILNSGQLGWINCDRFYNVKEKTDLTVDVDTAFCPVVRLVFKDINSVMPGYYTLDKKMVIRNIPVGHKATLIAFCTINSEPYYVSKDIIISRNHKENLELMKTTLAALKQDLQKVN